MGYIPVGTIIDRPPQIAMPVPAGYRRIPKHISIPQIPEMLDQKRAVRLGHRIVQKGFPYMHGHFLLFRRINIFVSVQDHRPATHFFQKRFIHIFDPFTGKDWNVRAALVRLRFRRGKENEMHEGDNPPVGILLCTRKGKKMVEYAIAGMDNNLFVSTYMLQLPDKATLEKFLLDEMHEQD